jgi:hypothetical protein
MSDKQTLQSQITQLKNVLASPKTDGTTRKILESGLKKAEAKLEELEKAEKLESSKKELTPKQEAKIEETKKESKSLADALKEKVKKAKQKVAKTTPKATKKGGARSVAKAKALAKEIRSKQKKQSTSDADIESDANRYAINKTKRTSHGGRANQYGTKSENKGGTYYESRENRYDRQNKRYAKLMDGGMMADGGEIKVGDYVIVDNPHWKASMGSDKPVRRKVKMIVGEGVHKDLFFTDGSTSSLKYVKKLESGGTTDVGGTMYSPEDLSGMFAKGGMTEHGLMIGDIIVGTSNDPYSIVVRNNGMEAIVDLNEGTRINQGTRFASRSMKDPMVVRTQFEEMNFEYMDGGMMAKGGIIATSPSLEGIKKIISNYYYSSNISLKKNEDSDEYEVHNAKGKINSVKVIEKKGRFQFVNKMADGGMMAKGGKIKNQYEGRTASEVWEMWSEKQKSHFLLDHSELLDKDRMENNLGYSRIVQKDMSYSDLTPMTKRVLQAHIQDGQYADGGTTDVGGTQFSTEDLSGMFEHGGRIKGSNAKTGETYGVVIGSHKKSDEYVKGGTEMNVRSSYSSRISEVKLIFDSKGNLHEIIDYGSSTDGYPNTSRGSGRTYNADKKETLKVLSEKYNPSFAKKLIESVSTKMDMGGVTYDDKVTSISKSLMKRKKVSPSVQKDYGKTYSKDEAIDSAKRIAGAMRKKEMAKKKR